jgi:hypothetical protein
MPNSYLIPSHKKHHLVVSTDIHRLVLLYSRENGISVKEATYRLLKLGLAQVFEVQMPESEIRRYEIREPLRDKFRRWFHKKSR